MYSVWWFAVTGPSIYRVPSVNTFGQSADYEQNQLERASMLVIQTGNVVLTLCKWLCIFCSPWIIPQVLDPQRFAFYMKTASLFSIVYLASVLTRGIGRMMNHTYRQFISLYQLAQYEKDDGALDRLTLYAFSSPWPAQFDVRDLPSPISLRSQQLVHPRPTDLPIVFRPLTWLFAKTIGICLVYPGCTWIMNSRTLAPRLYNRDRLRRWYSVKVVGLTSRDGEFVEAFYADRRGSSSSPEPSAGHGDSKGEILIVCCEGNGGYPEIGVPLIPLEQGYSILAWNHPGFGQSTGSPFPNKEHNAIEAVMLFATERLRFPLDQIYLFGWSIGGYAASWAAMNFPGIGGLILDATFDDLDELASRTVPELLYPFAIATLHNHLDLNNVANLVAYDGPVRMIRRGEDEILSTSNPPTRSANRGNFLLIRLLKHRFPNLMTPENQSMLEHYLSLDARRQGDFIQLLESPPEQYGPTICDFLKREAISRSKQVDQVDTLGSRTVRLFPSELGGAVSDPEVKQSMLFYLVTRYFAEAPDSHCAPLNSSFFRLPWSPLSDSQCSTSFATSAVNGTTSL